MDRYLLYRIKKELTLTVIVTAVVLVVWIALFLFMSEDVFTLAFDMLVFNIIALAVRPMDGLGFYTNFAYSRKRFYKSQIIIVLIQSFVLGLIRTAIQYVFYNDYVAVFMKGTEHTIEMYHRVAFPELLLTNMAIFMVFNMLNVLGPITGLKFLYFGYKEDGASPQLKLRVANCKLAKGGMINGIVRWLLKPLSYILMLAILVVVELSAIMLYWFQMLYAFPYRIAIVFGILVVFMIMYLVGKSLYKPKFV